MMSCPQKLVLAQMGQQHVCDFNLTFIRNNSVLLHLTQHFSDAILLLRVEEKGLLPNVDGDHLSLRQDVDEGAVRLQIAVDAELLHVLHGGAYELDGAALAGVALPELHEIQSDNA